MKKTNVFQDIDIGLLEEVKEYGQLHWEECYIKEDFDKFEIKFSIYEFEKRIYMIREVNETYVLFRDITTQA